MKPDQEIQAEAGRLEQLVRQWIATSGATPAAATLMVLPEPRIGEAARLGRRFLRVEVTREADAPEFLLVQDETYQGQAPWQSDPLVLTRSDSAYDVLRDGYEAQEEERLVELLTPIVNRVEEEGFIEDADPDLVKEIEAMVEADHLAPSLRLRTRADIVELLEGRLGPSDFISAAIERRGPPQERQRMAELLNERITVT